MRRVYEYTLTVRTWIRFDPKAKPTTVKVIASSKFDAELAFTNKNPRMMVLKAERGKEVHG